MFPYRCILGALAIMLVAIVPASASEADALAITANIRAKHMPFGTILDPIYALETSNEIIGYSRCGDSALWTGAFLAAEAFRYKVTQSTDALNNVRFALTGLKGLADVTGNNLLARCIVLASSPYAAGIRSEEANNGVFDNAPWFWVGNTSRDQFVGAIFGLGAAYDLIGDAAIKASIADLVTRLVAFLTGHNWSVTLPDRSGASFLLRPDELLSFLQVGRHVNSDKFSTEYTLQRIALSVGVPSALKFDTLSDDSYFKFNLGYMTSYNLIRLESSSFSALYENGYDAIRDHTAPHGNAFFNMVDRALNGANATRDAETRVLLEQWLQRPRRDFPVDLTKTVQVCGNQACNPVPVLQRPPTDFLWQRSPFQLTGGGNGRIEGPGIDYILPYWMARYYGVVSATTVQSAAASGTAVAPNSLASIFGSTLASSTAQADTQPWPTSLGGATLSIRDAAGTQRSAQLSYASPGQINFWIPDGLVAGAATFTVTNGSTTQTATATIQNVAPTLFSMNGNGTGVAAATAIRTQAGNPQIQAPVAVFNCVASGCTSVPIALGIDTPVFVALYGTGIRNRSSLANVTVTINGIATSVQYAGPQTQYAGLDQVNIALPLSLRGAGESKVVLMADGQVSNTVTLNIQ